MSYAFRLAALRATHAAINARHGASSAAWRDDRHTAHLEVLADALGTSLDQLDDDERTAVEWVATWDAETVAGIAALCDRAAAHRETVG